MCECVSTIHTYIIFVAVTLLVTLTLTYTHVHLRHNSTICPLVFLSLLNTFHPISPDSCLFFAVTATFVFVFVFCFYLFYEA